ncbi:hypothetical protein KY290_034119 [Solanum tuberosum]|uniref:Uncharacterized protein n=1 Tax=Solanum tuberosum TaxID=4113 RepID=A0ABQ7U433_SOLTU|nr:hypothetical protein KY289_033512 [Solanum tuberosum]KAH0741076.1 hypothetical protein KY290_034119 [Solanum tuberosum]
MVIGLRFSTPIKLIISEEQVQIIGLFLPTAIMNNKFGKRRHYLEEQDLLHNSEVCREELHKGQAEYIRWMAMPEKLLKQKA